MKGRIIKRYKSQEELSAAIKEFELQGCQLDSIVAFLKQKPEPPAEQALTPEDREELRMVLESQTSPLIHPV
ncbi:MAG: hypothetical protein NT026_02150 [Candidatus Staskawiczbacteria bacterium]|nr:hypothetical protein [Candidatus Staskawiczbacteria bacterium]